jgi:hypothetical protein
VAKRASAAVATGMLFACGAWRRDAGLKAWCTGLVPLGVGVWAMVIAPGG